MDLDSAMIASQYEAHSPIDTSNFRFGPRPTPDLSTNVSQAANSAAEDTSMIVEGSLLDLD